MRVAKPCPAGALESPPSPLEPPHTRREPPPHHGCGAADSSLPSGARIQSEPSLGRLWDRWTLRTPRHLTKAEPTSARLARKARPLPDPDGCGHFSPAPPPSCWGVRCTRRRSAVDAAGENI